MSEPSASLFEDTPTPTPEPMALAPGRKKGDDGHFKTLGEKKFDFRVYNLIGYILNAVISVFAVWGVERTPRGHQLVNSMTTSIANKTGANPHVARYLANRTFLLVGGFAVLLPMKWMEDRKPQRVKKWNREIYGEKANTDPVIRQSEQEVAEAPKQTWSSIFLSRVIALIPFYITVGLLWNRTSQISQWTNPKLRDVGASAVAAQKPRWENLGFGKRMLEKISIKADTFAAAEHHDATAFSKLTTPNFPRGIYFDRPLAWVGRWIGRGAAAITGNREAGATIRDFQTKFPGHILNDIRGQPRDPAHVALPYYVATEAITSGIVAWGVYQMTRVLGPLIGKESDKGKKPKANQMQGEMRKLKDTPQQDTKPLAKVEERPATRVDIAGIEHQAAQREHVAKRDAAR